MTRCRWIRYYDSKGNPDQCEDDAVDGEYCQSHRREACTARTAGIGSKAAGHGAGTPVHGPAGAPAPEVIYEQVVRVEWKATCSLCGEWIIRSRREYAEEHMAYHLRAHALTHQYQEGQP